jgi:hypothetical protein
VPDCATCRHWVPISYPLMPTATGTRGVCRRYPPVAAEPPQEARQPVTRAADTCGEWTPLRGSYEPEDGIEEVDGD